MPDLRGRCAVVTGGSRGLGRCIALLLSRAGAFVYVGYHVQESHAKDTLREIEQSGGSGALLRLDVRKVEQVKTAADFVSSERGGADFLINNAGVVRDALFPLMEPQDFSEVLSVNLMGTFLCCRAFSKSMMVRRHGAIVNIASVAGLHASAGQANYAASKGGILALTRTVAVELAPFGIRVNAVVPGLLSIGMASRLDHRVLERQRQLIPLKRFGSGEEVAAAVSFLLSEEASYIVGQAIVVDGGMTL
jgi:3-oxoacyl-[acyl-carrier protein] reductase